MKKFLFLTVAFFSIQLASAQDTAQVPAEDNTIYTKTEVNAEFPGGIKEFYKFIGSNFNLANVKGNGKIFVQFIVEKDGTLTDIKALRDFGNGSGSEAVRVLIDSPAWKPGIQNGQPVRCKYIIPIVIGD